MEPKECPKCKANFQGEPIKEEYRYMYGPNATHYSRVIAFVDRGLDRTTHWMCPDCGHKWDRG